jgi:thiol-disulfide isomerase/thioredoxin
VGKAIRFWGLFLVALLWAATGQAANKCKVALGGPAPALAGADLSGAQVSLESMRGKWVYLDFWASWCKPCMKELPHVVELHQAMGDRQDFAVMSIALDDQSTLKDLRNVASRYQVAYPVVCDSSGWQSPHVQDWCVESIPTTYLIDPTGRVVERDISPSEVKRYISQKAVEPPRIDYPSTQPQAKPSALAGLGFNAKHRVLKDSPTSGKRGYRDMQISLPGPAGRSTARYLIVVRAEDNAGNTLRIRYDLEFAPDGKRADFPYAVTIREASGTRGTRLPTGERTTQASAAVDVLPGAQITFDNRERRLMFVLPLPPDLALASYTTSLFNPDSQAFENSLAADIRL